MMSLEEQYSIISKEIEDENQAEMNFLINSLVNAITDDESDNDDKEDERRYTENLTALLAFRINIELLFVKSGKDGYISQLDQDVDEVLDKILIIEDGYEIGDEILSHFICLISFLSANTNKEILSYLENKFERKVIAVNEITPSFYFLFVSIANAYKRLGKDEVYLDILKGINNTSIAHGNKTLHRKIIPEILSMVYEVNSKVTVEIAHRNVEYYQKMSDEYSGNYYWIYANALRDSGNEAESILCFEKCYHIRKLLYGDNSWYTIVAKREYTSIRYLSSHGKNEFEYLLNFINKIEDGAFNQIDENTLKFIQGKTLYILLSEPSQINDLSQYKFWLEKYEHICELYNESSEPLLKVRLAKNLEGLLYLNQGNYILAEEAFREAIDSSIPENVPDIVPVEQIKTNLLLSTSGQNDLEVSMPIIAPLFD